MGRFRPDLMSATAFRENFMPRIQNVAIPLALLLSALTLSGCASEPKVAPVAAPAPVEVVAQVEAPAPAPVAAPAPAPVAIAAPAPQPVAAQPKKKAVKRKPAPVKVAPPAPAPVPVVEPVVPPPVAPPKPAPVPTPPPAKVAEPGFLEQYWLWLVVLGVVTIGVVAWLKSRKS